MNDVPVPVRKSNQSTELGDAVRLANRVLDRPFADPDDDLALLARQFLRQIERTTALAAFAKEVITARWEMGTDCQDVSETADRHGLLTRIDDPGGHPDVIAIIDGDQWFRLADWLQRVLKEAEGLTAPAVRPQGATPPTPSPEQDT